MAAADKWKKGQSGNPSGLRKDGQPRRKRQKQPPGSMSRNEFIALARSYSGEALERLVFWMRSKNARMSTRASQLLIERGHGTAVPADRIENVLVLYGDNKRDKIEVVFVAPPVRPEDGSDPRVIH
jgi:hypothetical protein